MSYIKSKIFLGLTKPQKSAICNFLRALVKKSPDFDVNKLVNKFFEDEEYYFKIKNPHFEFMEQYLYDENFKEETRLYILECRKYYDFKETQRPLLEKQKEFNKKKRKFAQEIKMSHEEATKKQLYYYKRLCEKYNINMKDTKELSKLDLKNMISEILDEYSRNSEHIDISRN